MIRSLEDDALSDIAVFPLPHVVLFPEALLPLHIFEPRYRAMLADALERGGAIVIAQVERGSSSWRSDDTPSPGGGGREGRISEIAGAGVIIEHQSLPDGRSNIIVAGCARVRLDELVREDLPRYPYKRARATRLENLDVGVSAGDRSALLAAAAMFATEVKKHDPTFTFRMPKGTDAGVIADNCAFQLVIDAGVRQAILEELDPRARVRMVMDQLALQHGAMIGEVKGTVLN